LELGKCEKNNLKVEKEGPIFIIGPTPLFLLFFLPPPLSLFPSFYVLSLWMGNTIKIMVVAQ